jgi:hypothetical protein
MEVGEGGCQPTIALYSPCAFKYIAVTSSKKLTTTDTRIDGLSFVDPISCLFCVTTDEF